MCTVAVADSLLHRLGLFTNSSTSTVNSHRNPFIFDIVFYSIEREFKSTSDEFQANSTHRILTIPTYTHDAAYGEVVQYQYEG
jgi:hypothetical protein